MKTWIRVRGSTVSHLTKGPRGEGIKNYVHRVWGGSCLTLSTQLESHICVCSSAREIPNSVSRQSGRIRDSTHQSATMEVPLAACERQFLREGVALCWVAPFQDLSPTKRSDGLAGRGLRGSSVPGSSPLSSCSWSAILFSSSGPPPHSKPPPGDRPPCFSSPPKMTAGTRHFPPDLLVK